MRRFCDFEGAELLDKVHHTNFEDINFTNKNIKVESSNLEYPKTDFRAKDNIFKNFLTIEEKDAKLLQKTCEFDNKLFTFRGLDDMKVEDTVALNRSTSYDSGLISSSSNIYTVNNLIGNNNKLIDYNILSNGNNNGCETNAINKVINDKKHINSTGKVTEINIDERNINKSSETITEPKSNVNGTSSDNIKSENLSLNNSLIHDNSVNNLNISADDVDTNNSINSINRTLSNGSADLADSIKHWMSSNRSSSDAPETSSINGELILI